MVKAAAGGGGRGMRLVTRAEDLLPAVQSARNEALSGFGSGELLLERALLHPRHVEVQIFADTQGHCVHLGERDCSVQRRHQKIIEESPSPVVDAGLRERMGRCATELALAAGYVGAGTVEFLLEGEFFFLMEMNTRLQVEHPVTEMRTGLDLVEWQLRVARGESLPLTQEQVQFRGHAMEVRLCAEDENFVPHTGTVLHFRAPPLEVGAGGGLRLDHAIAQGMQVSSWYDSMLGKLIAHAPTRAQVIDQLAGALDHTEVLGLPTNRAFLAACLRSEGFRNGQAVIPFLAEQGEAIRKALQNQEHATLVLSGLAAVLSSNTGAIGDANALLCPFPRPTRLRHRGKLMDCPATTAVQAPVGMLAVRVDGSRWHAQLAGVDFFVEDASFDPPAGGHAAAAGNALRAPFNGKLVAVRALVGVQVKQGETLMVLESMKLEHSLAAPRDGVVAALLAAPGQQVAPGQVLLELEAIG
jgi:3-methylcrotonyl-CoA carboxylase alpha subunit/geranyl-CoA carboxylase alpha subunit